MKTFLFFLQTAFVRLQRGGQRSLVALLCVVFGVMSLVAMTTLAKSIEEMLVLEPQEMIGGDLTLDRTDESVISSSSEAGLQKLLADGMISNYTLIDYNTSLGFRLPDSAEMIFPSVGMGVDTGKYPLAGNLTFVDMTDKPLDDLLKSPDDVIITRDLALTYKLNVGDTILLSDLNYGQPLTAVIRGIASDTPNHQGSKIYFSHETSQALTGLDSSANTVLVSAENPDEVLTKLESLGWRVFTVQHLADVSAATQGALAMGLNDIGLLGLLVSGIGIANTMQALMRRRRKEVAIWKTLGYSSGRIQSMFIAEAGLLGFFGSLVGASLGVLLSLGMVGLFSRITTVLVKWSFSPKEAISGVVVGTMTTIIFAMWSIVSTSRVTPQSLLRNEEPGISQIPAGQGLLLGLLLVIPFMAIAVWVLKSFLTGLLVLIGTILALAVLGAILWLLVFLAAKIFPTRNWALGKISRKGLTQRGSSQFFAMVALFIGVFMLGLGTVITESGNQVTGMIAGPARAENLAIFTTADQEQMVLRVLADNHVNEYATGHTYSVNEIMIPEKIDLPQAPVLFSRSDPGTATITGALWGSRPDGAYAYPYTDIPVGTMLEITAADGSLHEVEVVGTFDNGDQISWPGMNNQFLVSEDLGAELGDVVSSQFYLSIEPERLSALQSSLGKALPNSTLLSMPDYQMHYVRQYQNLFVFVAAMAGLAVMAGILLVANSVNLAMLDRRFEIGVLKSIGYSRGQVIFTQVVEYCIMSLVVSLVALLLIWGMLGLSGLVNETLSTLLMLPPDTAVIIGLAAIILTGSAAVWAAWKPSSVSPVLILNDRD